MGDTDGLGGFEIAAQLTMLNVLYCKMSGYDRKFGYFLIVGYVSPKVNYRLYHQIHSFSCKAFVESAQKF